MSVENVGTTKYNLNLNYSQAFRTISGKQLLQRKSVDQAFHQNV